MYYDLKRRTIELLDGVRERDRASTILNSFIIALIFLNVLAIILASVESLETRYHAIFYGFEVFSIFIFTVEYVLRIWSCTALDGYHEPLRGRLRYARKPYLLVDLFTVLPFYIPFILPMDLRLVRIIRFFRIMRLFKLDRYIGSLRMIARVVRSRKDEVFSLTASMFVVVLLSAFFMYLVEHEAQPQSFSSIPMSIWWAISTLTTVGYGDMYPVTVIGRVLGCVIAVMGIGMFALPTSILGAGFMEEVQKNKQKKAAQCPHCGKDLP